MSLLEQLRNAPPYEQQRNQWHDLKDILVDSIPGWRHRKITLIRGEVIVQGSAPDATGLRHLYAVLHNERTAMDPVGSKAFSHADLLPGPRPSRARPAAIGVSRYLAEAETNYYTDPWVAWVTPAPDTFAAWIEHVATKTVKDTPAMERRRLMG